MQLKLVYRFLTTISEWTIDGFYSECLVSGQDDIPPNAPLILAATHHNELLDVALLSTTVPNNRHVSFWARATSFKNPLARPFLVSSGALPVNRNPNSLVSSSIFSNHHLFSSTVNAMLRGDAIGVFAEGASYTEPKIMQVLPGAAWAGVEYMQVNETVRGYQGPVIVPVAMVYTNKTKFQSRIWMSYGAPIFVEDYLTPEAIGQNDGDNTSAGKEAVKAITTKLQEELLSMTINASDWDTLFAVETARAILFGDETNIDLEHWVRFSKRLVSVFEPMDADSPQKITAKQALREYYALQRFCHLSEETLSAVVHHYDSFPSRSRVAMKCIRFVAIALFHWESILFAPMIPVFAPAYLVGWLSGKYLSTPGEPEGVAQHKGLAGGVGLGVALFGVFRLAWKHGLRELVEARVHGYLLQKLVMGGCAYLFVVTVWKWHKAFVRGSFKRVTNAATAIRLLVSQTTASPLPPDELTIYTQPPMPRPNAFIRRLKEQIGEFIEYRPTPPLSWRTRSRLIRHHLLPARNTAVDALRDFLDDAGVDVRELEDVV